MMRYPMSYTYEKVYVNSNYPAVTAEQANLYFNDGNPNFTLSTIFKCGANCSAEISCANYTVDFTKPSSVNKRTPYLVNRKQQPHDLGCDFWETIANQRVGQHSQNAFYTQNSNEYVIEFLKNKGLVPTQTAPKQKTQFGNGPQSNYSSSMKTSRSQSQAAKKRKRHKRDLKSIILLFEEYLAGNKYITLYDKNSESIKFADIFEKIDWRNKTTLSNHPKIYFGQAKALKFENYIRVQFSGKVNLESEHDKTISFTLYKSTCENSGRKSLYNELEKLADALITAPKDASSYFTLYYEGTFKINSSKDKTFVNLNQADIPAILDHIEITPN